MLLHSKIIANVNSYYARNPRKYSLCLASDHKLSRSLSVDAPQRLRRHDSLRGCDGVVLDNMQDVVVDVLFLHSPLQ